MCLFLNAIKKNPVCELQYLLTLQIVRVSIKIKQPQIMMYPTNDITAFYAEPETQINVKT